jgi:hypothetical protein
MCTTIHFQCTQCHGATGTERTHCDHFWCNGRNLGRQHCSRHTVVAQYVGSCDGCRGAYTDRPRGESRRYRS